MSHLLLNTIYVPFIFTCIRCFYLFTLWMLNKLINQSIIPTCILLEIVCFYNLFGGFFLSLYRYQDCLYLIGQII